MNTALIRFAVVLAATTTISIEAAAQHQPGEGQMASINNFTAFVNRTSTKTVNGSPYADSRWLMAHLTMSDNVQIPPLPLRYDVLNKRLVMHSRDAETDSAQLNDNTLVSFVLDEPSEKGQPARKRMFRRFMESPEPNKMADYVEVLHQGKFALLKHYEKTYIKAVPNNGMADTNDRINEKVTYYVSRPGAVPLPVKLTLKGLQVALPELAPTLKSTAGAESARTDAEWSKVLDKIDMADSK